MSARKATHFLYEWMDGKTYCCRVEHMLAPENALFQGRKGMHCTPVYAEYKYADGLEYLWYTEQGELVALPWKVNEES
jgi:hypothetical protein